MGPVFAGSWHYQEKHCRDNARRSEFDLYIQSLKHINYAKNKQDFYHFCTVFYEIIEAWLLIADRTI